MTTTKKPAQKRLYFVQLSTDARGFGKPDDDRSEHKQFLFAVEATADMTMLESLEELVREARKDPTGLLLHVKNLGIDWIIKVGDVRPGLLWEYSLSTEMPNGAAELSRSHAGVDEWESSDASDSRLFIDFADDEQSFGSGDHDEAPYDSNDM